MSQCKHSSEWRDAKDCDECRFRNALDQIVNMTMIPGPNPTTRDGRMLLRISELAYTALYPNWMENHRMREEEKIKNTGKKEPKIDPEKFAKAIGAEIIKDWCRCPSYISVDQKTGKCNACSLPVPGQYPPRL